MAYLPSDHFDSFDNWCHLGGELRAVVGVQVPALWRPCTEVDLGQAHGHPTCLGVNTHRGAEQNSFPCPFPHTDLTSFTATVPLVFSLRATSLIIDGFMPSINWCCLDHIQCHR